MEIKSQTNSARTQTCAQTLDILSVTVLGKCPLMDCEGWSGLMLWLGCPEKRKTDSRRRQHDVKQMTSEAIKLLPLQ